MRRFSILSLMGLVLAVAVSFAALRGANGWWAGGLVLATLGLLGYAILAVLHGRGKRRAAWLGFLVMAGGYFVAIRTLPEPEASWLPTAQALQIAQDRWFGAVAFTITYAAPVATPMTYSLGNAAPTGPSGSTSITTSSVTFPNPVTVNGTFGKTPKFYNPLWPMVPNRAAFTSVGHSLFGLLAGWLGALLSRWMWARREAQERREVTPITTESVPA